MKTIPFTLSGIALTTLAACGGGGGGHHGPAVQAPSGFAYADSPMIQVVDLALDPEIPSVQGQPDRFSVLPPLPAGLELDTTTGVIRGTPTSVTPRRLYTVSASNSAGSTSCVLDLSIVPAPRFAYSVSGEDSTITIFGIDAETGRFVRKGYQTPPTGELGAERICVHPSESFVYVPNRVTENISVYAIDPQQGWLTPREPVDAGPGPHRIAIRPDGRFVYVASRGADEIRVYSVDLATGSLDLARAPIATGPRPADLAIDAQGRFLFVALAGADVSGSGAGLQAYAIDPFQGDLEPRGEPVALDGMSPAELRVDPARNAVYVTLANDDSVLPVRYHVTTGALVPLEPNAAGDGPDALAIDPLGRFTFVANNNGASINSYIVDAQSGQLIQSGTTPVGAEPASVALDTAGRYLYVVNKGSSDVMQYAIDRSTGALASVDAWTVRPQPVDLAIVHGAHPARARTRFLHVANELSGDVSAYTVDPVTGAPTESVPTSVAGVGPFAVVTHARHPFAFVADRLGHAVRAFTVDGANGNLAPILPVQDPAGEPWGVALDPSGRFLYAIVRGVESPEDGWLATYSINLDDSTLNLVQRQPVGNRPVFVGLEPNGRFLYVANVGAPSSIQSFRVDAITGMPAASASPSPAPGVASLAFHPNGRSLYALLKTANTIVQYSIDGANGQAIVVAGGSRSGKEPVSLSLSPDGRFAYAAYQDSLNLEDGGRVSLFTVDSSGHLVTPAIPYQDGLHPSSIVVGPAGRFVYSVNAGTNDMSTFRVDRATGELTPQAPTPTGLGPRSIAMTATTQ